MPIKPPEERPCFALAQQLHIEEQAMEKCWRESATSHWKHYMGAGKSLKDCGSALGTKKPDDLLACGVGFGKSILGGIALILGDSKCVDQVGTAKKAADAWLSCYKKHKEELDSYLQSP